MRTLRCTHCSNRLFFENTQCVSCSARLGFVPDELAMVAFAATGDWQRLGDGGAPQRPCANRELIQCNWMVPAADPHTLCACCRMTTVIPSLDRPGNLAAWARLETAKRRLLYTLRYLRLPAPASVDDPVQGLHFEFLEATAARPHVLTGHENGKITLDIAEADDTHREAVRLAMHEPYRTLLGHFRHESGHYYWERLIQNSPWLDEFRQLFGDERADYAAALQQHYNCPRSDWTEFFVSAYASAHPWEDWAECWAHYLHLVDGLETAAAWQLRLDSGASDTPPLEVQALTPETENAEAVIVQHWLPVSQLSNAMNRSLGVADSYPFVMPAPVVHKLGFIHRVVRGVALA